MDQSAQRYIQQFRCPQCKSELASKPAAWPAPKGTDDLLCKQRSVDYSIVAGIPIFMPPWSVGWISPHAAAEIWNSVNPSMDLPSFIRLLDHVSSPELDTQGLWERAVGLASSDSDRHEKRILADPSISSWNQKASIIDSFMIDRTPPLIKPGDQVLDVCTGVAGIIAPISRKTPKCQIICIDKHVSFLEVKKNKWNRPNAPIFACGDVRRLPLSDSSVDVVIDNNGLWHVVDVAKAIIEISRVAKPNAYLIISAFSVVHDAKEQELRELSGAPLGFAWLVEQYCQAGFKVIEKTRIAGKEQGLPETEGCVLQRC